jgi:hypothetical protein
MKKQIISSVVAAAGLVVAFGSGAYGQTVNVDRITTPPSNSNGVPNYGGDSANGVTSNSTEGGEFTVIPTNTALLNGYVLGAGSNTATGTKVTDPDTGLVGDVGFQTFCLELNVQINTLPTGPLPYTISPTVLNGDTKPLAAGVAYLYSQFALGTLSGYDYVDYTQSFTTLGETSPRGTDAAYLQSAIWYLQGDISLSAADGTSNAYLGDLITAGLLSSSGTTGSALAAASADQYGVEVLNLGNAADNYDYQAMLVYQPLSKSAPDGGATVALLGMAFGGIEYFRRKLAA